MFEERYDFHSLRKLFNEEKEKQLFERNFNGTKVEDKFPFDEVEMSMYGERGEIIIGDTIYVMKGDRTFIVDNLSKVDEIYFSDDMEDNLEKDNIGRECPDCHVPSANHDISEHIQGDYKIEAFWKVKNDHPFLNGYVYVYTESYIWVDPWWGPPRWRKHRTNIEVGLSGEIQVESCPTPSGLICCDDHTYQLSYSDYHDSGYKKKIRFTIYNCTQPGVGYFDEKLKATHKQLFTVEKWVGTWYP